MSFNIIIADSALKDFKKLNEPYYSKIKDLIDDLSVSGLNDSNIKPLYGEFKGMFRKRAGKYRIIFEIEEENIIIMAIHHRQEVYKKK